MEILDEWWFEDAEIRICGHSMEENGVFIPICTNIATYRVIVIENETDKVFQVRYYCAEHIYLIELFNIFFRNTHTYKKEEL
jgi:hypothetical protein